MEETETGRTDDLDRALGRAWASDRPWELLTRLTEISSRMGGSPGERRAAGIVREEFEGIGVENVRTEEFPMTRWERGTTEFAVTEPVERSFRALALPYSPPGDVEGPLVDVGHGTPEEVEEAGEDLAGAIALASTTTPPGRRFVHRMETFGHAAAAGAAGFLFANHVPGRLPPTGSLTFDEEAAIPGAGVSRETGDWLADYAEQGGRARLRVDATTTGGTSRNVHGTLGPPSTEEVLLLAHYDAHDVAEGALDNGCGVAVVAGAAEILASLPDLGCRVRVAGVGCEEVGLIGAEALAADLDLESVRAVVNVDGAGRFRNLKAYNHACEPIAEVAGSVGEAFGQPIEDEPDPHPFSDHWPFLRAGVPSLQLHSESDERGRGWGHTEADTREKVDPRNLREHAMLAALLVRALARHELPRVPGDALREAVRDQAYEPGMRAAGIWPDGWE